VDRRHRVAEGQCGKLFAMGVEERMAGDHEPARSQLDQSREDRIEVALGAGIEDMEVQPQGMSRSLRVA
jgi:hypothetical protein